MKPTRLLIAVAILAALGGVTWWSNRKASLASEKAMTANRVLSVPEDQFLEIRIKKRAGELQSLKRQNGIWVMTQPRQLPADQTVADMMRAALSSLTAVDFVEDKAADLDPYGLSNPKLDITIIKESSEASEVLVGEDTPNGSGAYAKLANDPRVFTITSLTKEALDKTTDELRSKYLFSFQSEQATRMDLQVKGQTIQFEKNGEGHWTIVKPEPLPADSAMVDSLITKLKYAQVDLAGSAEAEKKYGTATHVCTVSVWDKQGAETMELRQDKDKNYYAKSTALEGVYKAPSDLGDALDKGLNDFRAK